jgi:hypothetical protein
MLPCSVTVITIIIIITTTTTIPYTITVATEAWLQLRLKKHGLVRASKYFTLFLYFMLQWFPSTYFNLFQSKYKRKSSALKLTSQI